MGRQLETRLLNEYLWKNYRTNLQWKNVPLGQLPTQEKARMYQVLLRRADAVVIQDDSLIIIETKMYPDLSGLGELIEYRELIKKTPRFEKYRFSPIKLIFVTTSLDYNMKQTMAKNNIEYVVYSPQWAKDYNAQRKGVGRV